MAEEKVAIAVHHATEDSIGTGTAKETTTAAVEIEDDASPMLPKATSDPTHLHLHRQRSLFQLLASETIGNQSATNTPKTQQVLQAVYKVGQFKANLGIQYLMVQSFMAGLFKSVGCQTFLIVGGGVLGAALFPVGLIAIVLCSAELFTGDLLILGVSFLSRKVSFYSLLRNLFVSWFLNFCGTLTWGSIISYASGVVVDNGQQDLAISLAVTKTTQPWGHILGKAVGANFLVCLALWQAMTAEEVASKILAIWFPIVAFVSGELEHVVANMYFIPVGMMLGADVTVGEMIWYNLIPSTIGNIIGGMFGLALPFWFLFDPLSQQTNLFSDLNKAMRDSSLVEKVKSNHPFKQGSGEGGEGDANES